MTTADENTYGEWIGRSNTDVDLITRAPLNALAATLDRDAPELVVPPLWHWAYFLSPTRMTDIGSDGHSKLHDFLPRTPFPRRMRAGGNITFSKLLEIGEQAERHSTVENVQAKTGASGQLIFVSLRHEISGNRGARITEVENIVYREAPNVEKKLNADRSPQRAAQWTSSFTPDPIILFNYSAVTLNSHRIHYDRTYSTQVEGYPGLVVHGPLTATLLLQLLVERVPNVVVKEFSYQAVGPLFDTASIQLCGRIDGHTATLWALDNRNCVALSAKAELAA